MKVLVTGASGRFAEYVVRALRGRHEVVLFSRTPPPADRADLPWIQGDLDEGDDCARAVQGVEAIQHLGAVPWPSDHPVLRAQREATGAALPALDATLRTNVMGTYNLMQAAVRAGVRTVVMAGSNCAFGHGFRLSGRPFPIHYLPLDEAHPSEVEDSYSYSKLAGEELLASFSRAYGLRTYVTRPSGITPPERLRTLAAQMAPVTAWSEWMWAYVASEDLAELHCLLMERAEDLPEHRVYVANALDVLAEENSADLVTRFRPELAAVTHVHGWAAFFSSARAQVEVGWVPRCSWRDYI
jgi:nucleoside-diphosphate-sugar epimerase